MATQPSGLVGEAFADNVVGTLPDVAAGLVLLVLAAVVVRANAEVEKTRTKKAG